MKLIDKKDINREGILRLIERQAEKKTDIDREMIDRKTSRKD